MNFCAFHATSTNFITAINNYQLQYYDDFPEIFGKIIETYVWNQLATRFENISLWRKGKKEIDFIISYQDNPTKKICIEVKFKTKIRNNDLKHLLDYSSSFGNQEAIVATKSTLDLQTISGVNVYFIPFYLI